MNILNKNFKYYFQLILIVLTSVIWVTIALSDTVIPNKNSVEKDTISFILSTGRASLNSPEDTDLARRRALEDALYLASIEGGAKIINQVKVLIKNKIPVLGHLGLLPQSNKGKFKSKGKTTREIKKLFSDALLLQKAGVFAIVLECVKTPIAKQITKDLNIPTIGIGSSVHCDGQVLVTDDLLGLNETKIKFVKKYLNIKKYINLGLKKYASDVKSKKYPSKKHSY